MAKQFLLAEMDPLITVFESNMHKAQSPQAFTKLNQSSHQCNHRSIIVCDEILCEIFIFSMARLLQYSVLLLISRLQDALSSSSEIL